MESQFKNDYIFGRINIYVGKDYYSPGDLLSLIVIFRKLSCDKI